MKLRLYTLILCTAIGLVRPQRARRSGATPRGRSRAGGIP